MMLKNNESYEVEIIDVSSDGEGIGRVEGVIIFVPDAIPGDTIITEITQLKKKYAKGILKNIIQASPDRKRPPCLYSNQCGGCNFQSMRYDAQVEFKKKWIIDCLVRIGQLKNPKVLDVITMEDPWHYRNNVQYAIGRVRGKEKRLRGCDIGFYRRSSHEVINIDACMLQADPAKHIVGAIREYIIKSKTPIYDRKSKTGVLQRVMIRTAFGTGEIMVVLVATSGNITNVEFLVDRISKAIERSNQNAKNVRYAFKSLILNVNKSDRLDSLGKENIILAGKGTIKDRLSGMDFEISPHSFYQVNQEQTKKLYCKVKKFAELTGQETVLDLYCGIGTIGLSLARDAKKIIGIESIKAAVIDANRNAAINGIVNAEFICGKAEEKLPELIRQGLKVDVIILDPPRAGCDPNLLEAVALAAPKRIVYVSCNPATLARDIKILIQNGYVFMKAQPVDMFPHTVHVETVVLMSRVDK